MKSILKIQNSGVNTLKEEILGHSNSKLKKIYVVASEVKETGYEIIEECLIDLKAKKFIAFGIDKKSTTRKMLENVLKYTKNVYIWDNNSDIEFNANVYAFEYDDEAYVYLPQGNVTDSMLDTDLSFYTKLVFDLIKDKKEYEEYIDLLTKQIKSSFIKLTNEYIDELAANKQIFTTKQYVHVVPSISELLGKMDKNENKELAEQVKPLPKIELNKEELNSFEIDLGDISFKDNVSNEEIESELDKSSIDNEEVYNEEFGLDEDNLLENNEEIEEEFVVSDELIDMESLVLENKVVKLDKSNIVKNEKKINDEPTEKQINKKINLSKVSNIVMELSKKPTKGKDLKKIKIPNYIKDMIPTFFEIMEDASVIKTEDGEYKEACVKLEIIDVNTSNKYVDNEAHLRQKIGQTYIEFDSDKLVDVAYEELDIARVIKLARNYYHIEIIPQGIEEYSLWDKLCTNNFKGSSRQYGLL